MKIVIAGGGNVGYYLAQTLCERRHRVSVVDLDRARCEALDCSGFGSRIEVTCGDATDEHILAEAGAGHCDVFIAATGQDQNNLTACMLAKERLGARRTITRVNNPKNIRVFQQLGVDSTISSAARIAGIIEQELDWTDLDTMLSEKAEDARLRQFIVAPGCFAEGRTVARLQLPPHTIIIVIVRANRAFIPGGATGLAAGDELTVMGCEDDLAAAARLFYEGSST